MQPPDPETQDASVAAVNSPPGARLADGPRRTILGMRRRILEGIFLGALSGLCVSQLGINALLHFDILQDILLLPSALGILASLSPVRSLLYWTVGILLASLLIVGYTPLVSTLAPTLSRSDRLEHSAAIVVLSTCLYKDDNLNGAGQERVLQAYLLLKQGYSDRLVLTRSIPKIGAEPPVIRRQMRALGLNYATDEVGPVSDTHDEATAVARLVGERGWKRLILVTSPWHMKRARAVFEKSGVHVLCSPCIEGGYDMSDLSAPGGRLQAFRDWLHETVGIAVYKLRGWL